MCNSQTDPLPVAAIFGRVGLVCEKPASTSKIEGRMHAAPDVTILLPRLRRRGHDWWGRGRGGAKIGIFCLYVFMLGGVTVRMRLD